MELRKEIKFRGTYRNRFIFLLFFTSVTLSFLITFKLFDRGGGRSALKAHKKLMCSSPFLLVASFPV